MGLKEADGIDFKYTTMILDDVYDIGFKHALQIVEKNGGKISGENVTIKTQVPVAVRYERSFEGLYPVDKKEVKWSDDKTEVSFEFTGTGFALKGETASWGNPTDFVFHTE